MITFIKSFILLIMAHKTHSTTSKSKGLQRPSVNAKSFDYSKFKISPYAKEIVELIQSHPVSAISAQTGSGKTLRIPYDLARNGCIVRVALPYAVATRAAADFQKKHSGLDIGFAAAREIKYGPRTQLVYATTGHFTTKIRGIIKKCKSDGVKLMSEHFSFLGHVFVVDEVHTGTVQITELTGQLKYIKTHVPEFNTRIVFTSATLNCMDVARHFKDFPTYNVDLDRLPITHIYSQCERDPKRDDPTKDIMDLIRAELKHMKLNNELYHIIVFRPGVKEVEEIVQLLEREFDESQLYAIPAYSELSHDDLAQIFMNFGVTKVIIGTNIIESSITVDNVGAIIDDGLVKRVYTNDTGGQKLVTSLISQAESIQRAGRTARTRPGRAFHLYTERYRETDMDKYHPPEIDRVPIHNITLGIVDAGLIPTEILGISKMRQTQALDTLIDMGMVEVDTTRNTLGKVTEAGNFVSRVNLGIYNAYMIYKGIEKFRDTGDELVLVTTVALAVTLECYGPPPFYVPRRKRGQTNSEYLTEKQAHIDTYFDRFRGQNELETLINLYWTMTDEIYEMTRQHKERRLPTHSVAKDWAVQNSMNNKKLKEFTNTMRPVLESVAMHLGMPQILDDMEPPSPMEMSDVMRQTLDMFRCAYSRNRFTFIGKGSYVDKHNNIYKHTSTAYSLQPAGQDMVIAAQVMEMQDKPGAPPRRMIGLSLPI